MVYKKYADSLPKEVCVVGRCESSHPNHFVARDSRSVEHSPSKFPFGNVSEPKKQWNITPLIRKGIN